MPNPTVRANATALPNSVETPDAPLLNRRSLIGRAAAAALSGAALGGTAANAAAKAPSEPDPVFAAIARHRSAWKAFSDTCNTVDEVYAAEHCRQVTAADEAAHESASEAEQKASYEAFTTPATTIAGMRTQLEYAIELEVDFADPYIWQLLSYALLASPVLDGDGCDWRS
jgi:hypothetical protein